MIISNLMSPIFRNKRKIYNKWGTKVFEWNEINYKWDGRGYSGENLPESVYYFVLDAVGISGQYYQTNGHINLLR